MDSHPGVQSVCALLFDDVTLLDALGPVDALRRVEQAYGFTFCSPRGGPIRTHIGLSIETQSLDEVKACDVLVVPGGQGTRSLVQNRGFLERLAVLASGASWVLSVCTGSALLAKAGLLEGRKATTNKIAFDWVQEQGPGVHWVRRARWVVDGKFYTSSGVTAGIDMALGFIADRFGTTVAEGIAKAQEYRWNRNKDDDPFA